jgi:hypothetical protein
MAKKSANLNQQPLNKIRSSVPLETLQGIGFIIERATIEEGQYGKEYLQMFCTRLDTNQRLIVGTKAKVVVAVMKEMIEDGFEPFPATIEKQGDTLLLANYDYDMPVSEPEPEPYNPDTQ